MNHLSIVFAVLAYLIAYVNRCLDCNGFGPGFPTVSMIVREGNDNWTVIISTASAQLNLASIKATLYDAGGIPQSPLVRIQLSNLTEINRTSYHAVYYGLYNVTYLAAAASIVIDKAAYPMAYRFVLALSTWILGQVILP